MNTEQMNQFRVQVSQAHLDEFLVMVVDGASSHRSLELRIPENIRLHRIRGYSRNSPPRSMSGMSCARRNFPTGFSSLWRQSLVNLKLAPRGWRQIPKRCEASRLGPGLLVSA